MGGGILVFLVGEALRAVSEVDDVLQDLVVAVGLDSQVLNALETPADDFG